MAAQLVFASGLGAKLDQREPRLPIRAYRLGHFAPSQGLVMGLRGLHLVRSFLRLEVIINLAAIVGPSTGHRVVDFLASLIRKLPLGKMQARFVQSEEQHATRGTVQAVAGINDLPDLIPDQLQGKNGFAFRKWTSVHQQASRFIDGDVVFILVNYLKRHRGIQRRLSASDNSHSSFFDLRVQF